MEAPREYSVVKYNPDASWRTEIAKYDDRVAALSWISEALLSEIRKFPGLLSFVPSADGMAQFRALIYVNRAVASSKELVPAIQLLWKSAFFLAAAHCVRLLFEQWGALIYLETHVIDKLGNEDGARIANERIVKLDLGAKSEPLLPARLTEPVAPINVMEFVRAGEKMFPGFARSYNLLCDIAHPSYVHSSFHWFGQDGAWANPGFAKEAHRILEQMIAAAEQAAAGITQSARVAYERCLPPLNEEIFAHRKSGSE